MGYLWVFRAELEFGRPTVLAKMRKKCFCCKCIILVYANAQSCIMEIMPWAQRVLLFYYCNYDSSEASVIRHINPLLFGVIDDKPEGVARGVYHV